MILRDRLRCPEPVPSRRQLLLGAATGLLLPGCTLNPDRDHDGADAPTSEVPLFADPASTRPITAWVLSSGGCGAKKGRRWQMAATFMTRC